MLRRCSDGIGRMPGADPSFIPCSGRAPNRARAFAPPVDRRCLSPVPPKPSTLGGNAVTHGTDYLCRGNPVTTHSPDDDRSLEAGDADLDEQRSEAAAEEEDWTRRGRLAAEDEVSEADAVEQLREVDIDDEEEYR